MQAITSFLIIPILAVCAQQLHDNEWIKIVPISGKGFGVTAKQKIIAGTIVLTEKPLFTRDWESNKSVKQKHRKKVLQLRASSVENNEKIFRLHGGPTELITKIASMSMGEKEVLFQFPHLLREQGSVDGDVSISQRKDEIHLIKSMDTILNRNTFGPDLYDDLSKFNHACDSNAQYLHTRKPYLGHVQVVRDIEEDEEVTVCYVDPEILTEDERTKQIKQWDFTCDCSWCGIQSEDRKQDETERIRLYLSQRNGATEANAAELFEFARRNIKDLKERGRCGHDLRYQYGRLLSAATLQQSRGLILQEELDSVRADYEYQKSRHKEQFREVIAKFENSS